jgi:exodeoxyribonuclease V beta subunit
LHWILERIDFQSDVQWSAWSLAALQQFEFDETYLPAILSMLRHTVAQVLPSAQGTFSLASIATTHRLSEMPFTLPIKGSTWEGLLTVLQNPALGLDPLFRQAAAKLKPQSMQGYLNGVIDLLAQTPSGAWVLIDYKSNTLADYTYDGLKASVADAHYYLQYTLYCVAVRRFMRQHGFSYDTDFLGVYYLYVRAFPSDHHGVWFDKPSPLLLDALDAYCDAH